MRSSPREVGCRPALHDERFAYPFTLGVASGDPLPGAVMLWTRLAPEPELAQGGMPQGAVRVRWEVACDQHFERVVRAGDLLAVAHSAHSVHADVRGLVPGAVYWYRFHCGVHVSPVGCTRTAPEVPGHYEGLRFAVVSGHGGAPDSNAAYDAVVREDLDLVLFLGEYAGAQPLRGSAEDGSESAHELLARLRVLYAAHKREPNLQAAHAAFPWLLACPPLTDELLRSNAALRAFWEHMPIRLAPHDGRACRQGARLTRRFGFGNLVEVYLAPGSAEQACRRDLGALSQAHWQLVLHETSAGRQRGAALPNLIHLSRGLHESALHVDDADGAELVAGPLSAVRGQPVTAKSRPALYRDRRPGYLRCELDHESLRADFLVLPQNARGALQPAASFVFERGLCHPREA